MNAVGGGVVNHTDLFHTGIVVDDLASSKEELGAVLGVTWREGGAEVRLTDVTGVRVRAYEAGGDVSARSGYWR